MPFLAQNEAKNGIFTEGVCKITAAISTIATSPIANREPCF
jgi:hypothetical protein